MPAPFTQYTINSYYESVLAAQEMVEYWEVKELPSGVEAWTGHLGRLLKQLTYIADRLEWFAKLRPGNVQNSVMIQVNEIRRFIEQSQPTREQM